MIGPFTRARELATFYLPFSLSYGDGVRGRRFRAFVQGCNIRPDEEQRQRYDIWEWYKLLEGDERLATLHLRFPPAGVEKRDKMIEAIPEGYTYTRISSDHELHRGLQDLGWQIGLDIKEAAGSLDNPDIWYPGVDDGIEPVSDEHVKLVIWALQRELVRELRGGRRALPLAEFPWRIQRALVERRRLRFKQWGIGRREWETNCWNLWSVPEDDEWAPPWVRE
jgi:hypothetical protein